MHRRLRTFLAAASLAALGIVGIAFAVDQSADDPLVEPPRATHALADGRTADGGSYTISAVDTEAPRTMFCFEIATERQRGHGCAPVTASHEPDAKSLLPRRTLLGTDRFASLLAPPGIEGMRVVNPDGKLVARAQAVAVDGVGDLLVAAWGGDIVSSRSPDPDRTLELLDAEGKPVAEVPFPGFGKAAG